MKYHLSADGKVRPCRAKGSCPFGSGFSGEKGSSGRAYIEGRKAEENRYSKALENKIPYSQEEAEERGRIVNETMNKLISGGFTTQRLHSKNGVYKPERQKLHEEILTEFEEKYKHIPSENKVIFSAGLPGAGKTTILTTQLKSFDVEKYATVSSDDFKERMASKGMFPDIEGFSSMEVSTLGHLETSYLADEFLKRMSSQGKNIIYDFTCKDYVSTTRRIGLLENNGYSKKDMQFVFVDIPLDTAKERAIGRYTHGLNETIERGEGDGGRYLPTSVLDASKSKTGKYSSKNAEALLQVYKEGSKDGMPEPLIFDNSGDSRKDPSYTPSKVNFEDFANK